MNFKLIGAIAVCFATTTNAQQASDISIDIGKWELRIVPYATG
jgi:hypothetical protein